MSKYVYTSYIILYIITPIFLPNASNGCNLLGARSCGCTIYSVILRFIK